MTQDQARRMKERQADVKARLLAAPAYKASRLLGATPEGLALLNQLAADFDGDDLVGESVEETFFNLGARSVVRELRRRATDAGTDRTGDST